MLSEKEKKIGIIMLVVGAVIVVALIVSRVYTNRLNQGIRGNGVSDGAERESMLPVGIMTPVFYDTTLGDERGESSLGQAAALGVVAEMVQEVEAASAVAQEQARQEAEEAVQAERETSATPSVVASHMTSQVFAGRSVDILDGVLETDDVSLTGGFSELPSAVDVNMLALCGVHYEYSNLDKVRVLSEGSLSDNNSLEVLYSDVISKEYKEGTYCAYLITGDSLVCLGGDERLCLLLGGFSADEVAGYISEGRSLESLIADGVVSLVYGVGDGETESYRSVYDMCGIGYSPYFVETLGADRQLSVVHLVGDKAYVENYAVGGLYTVDYGTGETVGTYEEEDETVVPMFNEVQVPVFTGYYCW